MNEWEAIHQSRHWGTYPSEYMVRQVKHYMATNTGRANALDIGCGVGAHSWMMDREGLGVTAIDVSPTAIARLPAVAPGVSAYVCDIASASFLPGSFDFILDNLSLTHVEKPPLDRILSWLSPGGRLVSASFLVPPPGAPKSWPVNIGTRIETHTREVDGHTHIIGLSRYDKPCA